MERLQRAHTHTNTQLLGVSPWWPQRGIIFQAHGVDDASATWAPLLYPPKVAASCLDCSKRRRARVFGVRPRVGSERTTHRFNKGLDLDRKTCTSGAFFAIKCGQFFKETKRSWNMHLKKTQKIKKEKLELRERPPKTAAALPVCKMSYFSGFAFVVQMLLRLTCHRLQLSKIHTTNLPSAERQIPRWVCQVVFFGNNTSTRLLISLVKL